MISKSINADTMALPGDIALGLLRLHGVALPARAMAIIASMHDAGPNEIMVLGNQHKLNLIFSQGIHSFVDILNEAYYENRFYMFKALPKKIELHSVPCMVEDPLTLDGRYVAFWGLELPPSHKKNSWTLNLLERTGKEIIGEFEMVDIMKEEGMIDMLSRIKRDGRRA